MTKVRIWIVLALFIAGGIYFWHQDKKAQLATELKHVDLELEKRSPSRVVYAVRDVYEGAVLTAADVEEESIEKSNSPSGAINRVTEGIGHKVKYGLSKGQIVSGYDFDPPLPNLNVLAIRAARDINEGQTISANDFEVIQIRQSAKPADALSRIPQDSDLKTTRKINKGEMIYANDMK